MTQPTEDIIQILRVVEYVGPRSAVDRLSAARLTPGVNE